MRQVTPEEFTSPAAVQGPEILALRSEFDLKSPLDEIVRRGAQQMLQSAIEAEISSFLLSHSEVQDSEGRRLVVRNGYLPSRDRDGTRTWIYRSTAARSDTLA